jgi:enolase
MPLMPEIEQLHGLEILDSRGRPTVLAACRLEDGTTARASVPSGASTGAAEAHELRDGEANRFGGLGCRQAAANIAGEISDHLRSRTIASQAELDRLMIELDGTPNKSRLGANAILATSIAFARACATSRKQELFDDFASLVESRTATLPRMTINLFSGGKHAGQQVAIQDVLVVPHAPTISEGLAVTYAVYQAAAKLIQEKYGMRLLRADEGGLAPPCRDEDEMLADAVQAISRAGLRPGQDVSLAVDVASSHFYRNGRYHLSQQALSSAQMIDTLRQWVERYPIISIEDGLAEDDWDNWPALRQAIGERVLVLGDDFLCTNPQRIGRAIQTQSANALLLKVNQIGTLTEAGHACRLASSAGWKVTVSARSGETEDDWLADLACAWGDQIKVGSITQSERLAKYNRLLEIEQQTKMPVVTWPASSVA